MLTAACVSTGSSTSTSAPGGERRLGLLLLLGRVLIGVRVQHLIGAEFGDARLEERAVEGLVARCLRVGQQQRDLAPVVRSLPPAAPAQPASDAAERAPRRR